MPGKFKGAARTLNDPSPPKPVLQPKKAQSDPAGPPPKPEGPPPGPDNRQIKMSTRDAGVASAGAAPTSDEDYKLRGSDIKGMAVGSRVQPKTFADARPAARQQPLTANVKFVVQLPKRVVNVEAKFQTSEKVSALHEFLETHVFDGQCEFEIRQAFPAMVIPRDTEKALAAMKIAGSVMFTVMVKGDVKIKEQK